MSSVRRNSSTGTTTSHSEAEYYGMIAARQILWLESQAEKMTSTAQSLRSFLSQVGLDYGEMLRKSNTVTLTGKHDTRPHAREH
jgi:hypothetical protein